MLGDLAGLGGLAPGLLQHRDLALGPGGHVGDRMGDLAYRAAGLLGQYQGGVFQLALAGVERSVAQVGQHEDAAGNHGNREQKAALVKLSPEDVTATEPAGEPIVAKLTRAPVNDAPIGGLKVVTENAWFAARPSGTEDVYKIYAESFRGPAHLERVVEEARGIVAAALRR